jgi:hypothetical protein
MYCHWHSHDHQKIIYATHKSVVSSSLPYYMHLQGPVLNLKEISIAKQNFMFANYTVANMFKCNETTIHRNKQAAENDNNA